MKTTENRSIILQILGPRKGAMISDQCLNRFLLVCQQLEARPIRGGSILFSEGAPTLNGVSWGFKILKEKHETIWLNFPRKCMKIEKFEPGDSQHFLHVDPPMPIIKMMLGLS